MKRNTIIAVAAAGAVIAGGTIGGVALASGSSEKDQGTQAAALAPAGQSESQVAVRDDDGDDRDDRDDRDEDRTEADAPAAPSTAYTQVTALALTEVPGFVTDLDRDRRDDGTVVWEVDIFGDDGRWYDVDIDEDATQVLRAKLDDDDDDDDQQVIPDAGIDIVEAILIAEEHTGAHFNEVDLDDDGRHWEVELRGDGFEHEVKVSVATGEVTQYEKDQDDD
ncbi:PepSY domain-containing protein [Streptomyces sp. JH002]|uniref:PepSY domain-containing protein n=1 Tax=Streptomyces sp. JH002 TaxID=2763259 RepID=UPI003D802FAA